MDAIELSDLEEGEILEYEFCSPDNSANDEEILENGKSSLQENQTEFGKKMFHSVHIKNNIFGFSKCREQRNSKKISREKVKFKYKNRVSDDKSKYELDSISSSEEEYRSDEDKDLNVYTYGKRSEGKLKKCHPVTYGTVEDIMSEIGETICRKSWCNYRSQRSRDIACSYNIINGPNDRMLPNNFSNIKKKYGKRKKSNSDSDSDIFQRDVKKDLPKCKKEKKKKKKRKNFYCHEHESGYRSEEKPLSKKLRDFDEVRRSLLEKLKEKQKAEEELRNKGDNPESQEIEISPDDTNSGKKLSDGEAGDKEKETAAESDENEEDEDLDLIKLRSMALASNRRKRNGESLENYPPETGAGAGDANTCSPAESRGDLIRNDEDADLDRNELLLRAEALKTALLKKHQRRLNKLKEKLNPGGSCSDNDFPSPRTLPTEKKSDDAGECNGEALGSKSNVDAYKENLCEEKESESNASCSKVSEGQSNTEEVAVLPCENPKKGNLKARNRKKKKKRNSLLNSVKENDASEAVEEDDRTLRSQLLCDLFKKKSLKASEKKPVLMDSVQTSANRFSIISNRKPEVALKSVRFGQNNVLKKVNINRTNAKTGAVVAAKPEIQRIIVHLGQEDSSEDDSELHLKQEEGEEEEEEEEKGVEEEEKGVSKADRRTVSKKVDENIQASYERSVELLLSQARKKIEGEKQKVEDDRLDTPEAVYKHLPPSQRLEYIRLKQKIAERERLRQSKKPSTDGSSSGPVDATPPGARNPAGPDLAAGGGDGAAPSFGSGVASKSGLPKKVTPRAGFPGGGRRAASASKATTLVRAPAAGRPKIISSAIRAKVEAGGGSVGGAPGNGVPTPSNLALISKLKLLLKKIKMEKTTEENFSKEIVKLKNQLSFFEKKRNEQRFKIKKLAEESMKIYKVVQAVANSKGAQEPGNGSAKAKDETGARAENTQDTEHQPPAHIKVESGSAKEGADSKISESAAPSTVELVEYNSPLQAFQKACVRSKKVDPNVIMCQFDLMGVCKDEECAYQHLRAS